MRSGNGKTHPLSIIVTGLSGSGKSTVLNIIEDAGYFCMDNIPIDLLMQLIELYDFASLNISNKICIGMDVRAGAMSFAEKAPWAFALLKDMIGEFRLIFLQANRETLLNRFKETRRRHPLSDVYPNLLDAIDAEQEMMAPVRDLADFVIDTSEMNVHELHARLSQLLEREETSREMYIEVRSFGFKNGLPLDADIVMDVRFLPNPYFVESLKDKTGSDKEVKHFLSEHETYLKFIQQFRELIEFVLPMYQKEGRAYLNIAVGCTGGKHRSVAVAEEIQSAVAGAGFKCKLVHRDVS